MVASLIERVTGRDFRAAPDRAHKGLVTTVTSGLVALHELRHSSSKARNNAASGQPNAQMLGYPTTTDAYMTIQFGNGLLLGKRANSGSKTICVVARNTSINTSNPVIFGSSTPTTISIQEGVIQLQQYGDRWTGTAYSYPIGETLPLTNYAQHSSVKDLPNNDAFEMMAAVCENNVSFRLYHPRTATNGDVVATVGRTFATNNPPRYQTFSSNDVGTRDMVVVAVWERALSNTEINTFYAEMKTQLAALPTPVTLI